MALAEAESEVEAPGLEPGAPGWGVGGPPSPSACGLFLLLGEPLQRRRRGLADFPSLCDLGLVPGLQGDPDAWVIPSFRLWALVSLLTGLRGRGDGESVPVEGTVERRAAHRERRAALS